MYKSMVSSDCLVGMFFLGKITRIPITILEDFIYVLK